MSKNIGAKSAPKAASASGAISKPSGWVAIRDRQVKSGLPKGAK